MHLGLSGCLSVCMFVTTETIVPIDLFLYTISIIPVASRSSCKMIRIGIRAHTFI